MTKNVLFIVSPILVENFCLNEQDVMVGGPSNVKSPRIEKSVLERMRASLKEQGCHADITDITDITGHYLAVTDIT